METHKITILIIGIFAAVILAISGVTVTLTYYKYKKLGVREIFAISVAVIALFALITLIAYYNKGRNTNTEKVSCYVKEKCVQLTKDQCKQQGG